MKRLVEFPTESGDIILAEVEDLEPAGGTTRRGLFSSSVERAQTSFEDALEKAQPMASMASDMISKVRGIADPPEEVQVEFGLTLSAQAGAVLVAGVGAGANYKITLKWTKPSEE